MANVKFYVNADNSSAMKAMNQVKGAVGNLGNTLNGSLKGAIASAFGVAAIEETIRRTVDYADNIDEASSRLDVGIEKLQEWGFAAKQSGVEMEALVGFTERLTKYASTKAGAIRLKAEGINPNQTPEALMESLWKFSKGKSAAQVSPFLMDVGGKSGGKMYNLFQNDMTEAAESARRLGAIMDTETVVKLAALSDQLSILSQVIASNVGPALISLAGWAYKVAVKTSGAVEKTATKVFAAAPEIGQSLSSKRGIGLSVMFPGLGPALALKEGMDKYKQKEADIAAKQDKFGIKQGSSLEENLAAVDDATNKKLKDFQDWMDGAIANAKIRGKTAVTVQDQNGKVQTGVGLAEIKSQPSSNVSIGGIAGINTQYRIERINKDMLQQLIQIKELLRNPTTNTEDEAL